ncbi:unnamed protein product, partial [Ectocarpus sp. 12 AP-2014]
GKWEEARQESKCSNIFRGGSMSNAGSRVGMDAPRTLPRGLDVESFAKARIQELEFLDAAVAAVSVEGSGASTSRLRDVGGTIAPSAPAGGLRDQSQALPRHMRRRTTSHTPRRMTVALKNSGRAAPNNGRSSTSSNKNKHSGRRHGSGAKSSRSKGDGIGAAVDMDVDAQRCRKHRRRPRSLLEMHSPHAVRDEESGGEDEAGKGRTPRWLETHIWHAKRMHMKHAWGFVLPAESNRGPRAAVEAALKHCTLQDLTFMRPLELRGPRWCILGALSAVTDPLDSRPKQQSCVDGFVEARTHLYRANEFPLGCVAPVTVLWAPSDSIATANDEDATKNDHDTDGNNDTSAPGAGGDGGGGGRATEGKEEGGTGGPPDGREEQQEDVRRVWVWVHPAAAKEALREIRKACDLEGSPWQGCVQAGPVPGGLCRLRVRGTRSHETVQRVLRTAAATAANVAPAAAAGDDYEGAARENAGHWRALGASPTKSGGGGNNNNNNNGVPREIPSGSVLAITALDPRQQRPNGSVRSRGQRPESGGSRDSEGVASSSSGQRPKAVGSRDSQGAAPAVAAAAVEQWPPRSAAVSPLWDPDARALADPRPDHVINEHRRRERARESWHSGQSTAAANKETGPPAEKYVGGGGGTPVILVSASGVPTTAHGQSAAPTARASLFSGDRGSGGGDSGGGKEAERKRQALSAGWDIVLSPGWAPVFFGALVMAGARAISLEDADGLMLEACKPRFPADFPDTASGRCHWDEVGRQAEEAWKRTRPKHRGFKRPALPPPPEAPSLPPPQSECGEGVTATVGDGSGATAGSDETAEKAAGDEGQQEEGQQQRQNLAPKPSLLPLRWFRPDFRSLAGAGDTPSTRAGSAERNGNVGDGDGSAATDASVVAWKPQEEREPYAVARGFQYVRAFLPDVEQEHRETDACDGDDDGDGGNRLSLDLPPPPPPLRLALPTVLELVIVQDKGVPKAGAPLHAASPKLHALWMQGRRNGKPWPGLPAKDTLLAAVGSPCGDVSATAAIGAVTSGGVSYLQGVGVGRGVCEAVAVRDALLASLFCCRQRRGSGRGGGGETRQWGQQRRAWALVLVGNEAGDWFRPAVAYMAGT